ncbi:hypothetical protein L4D76_23575 [Photobacterium sagamiensis]|uniref:hypothetical protein n=1 Tax=Photobacterium sagamiensis TaxID=2910241 RepID=UPI003D0C7D16
MKSILEKFTYRDGVIYINPTQVAAVLAIGGVVEIELSTGTKYIVAEGIEEVVGMLEG